MLDHFKACCLLDIWLPGKNLKTSHFDQKEATAPAVGLDVVDLLQKRKNTSVHPNLLFLKHTMPGVFTLFCF